MKYSGLAAVLAAAAFVVPTVASAAVGFSLTITAGNTCAGTICQVASTILYLINGVAVPLLFAVAFIVFLYGVASAYIFSRGDPGRVEEGHKLILWGIIGFVVMISLWGLVNVVASTFGLGGYSAPPLPNSTGSSYY